MTDKINDGGPAFPRISGIQSPNTIGWDSPRYSDVQSSGGMSLRDYFAAKAMAALLVAHGPAPVGGWPVYAERTAYLIADAMLAAREVKHD